ncbi:MAG: transposase [Opitutales bacterium]|nr:transposase [Opitutales bacterium]
MPRLLAIDGKVIGKNLATLVSLVDARDGTPVAQFAASGNGQEQALMKKLIDEIEPGKLEDKWIRGDALYSHKELVRTVVQDHGGHVLMQLKANQLKALEQAQRRFEQDAPPF